MSTCSTIASSSRVVSRTPSAKRKRTTKSPPDADSPPSQQPAGFTFESRLFQLQTTKEPASSTPHPPIPKEPKQPMEVASSTASTAVCPPPTSSRLTIVTPAAGQLPETSWSFLAHPALRLLPKWPALYENDTVTTRPLVGKTLEEPVVSRNPLTLLSLLDIPPIAASLAGQLYGHDLLNLRCLNRQFHSLLSSERAQKSSRTYYEVLLLKTLLCPRTDISLEPVGTPCLSAGGNVGPCVFCDDIVCTTCVSPEVWTTRRYRYICPSCTKIPTTAPPFCNCQQNLWICRACYKAKWLVDIAYDSTCWINPLNTNVTSTCALCKTEQTNITDKRLAQVSAGREFKTWITSHPKDLVLRVKGKSRAITPSNSKEGSDVLRRPVACAWCVKRVDAETENWELRPDKIRIGEERGRQWMLELERRRMQKEAEIAETRATDLPADGGDGAEGSVGRVEGGDAAPVMEDA